MSYSSDAIYACCDRLMTRTNETVLRINLDQAGTLRDQMMLCHQNEVNIFVRTTELLALGHLSPAEASERFRKHNVTHLVRLLPADPHQRLSLLHLLKKV